MTRGTRPADRADRSTSPSRERDAPYHDSRGLWYLEGTTEEGERLRRFPILSLPFRVGRLPGRGLTLSSTMISGQHAEIYEDRGTLYVRDLGSTNGTRLNGEPVGAGAALADGDTVHFARLEFRLGRADGAASTLLLAETAAVASDLPEPVVARGLILREMMRQRELKAFFQPIVELASGAVVGYESLGRGDRAGEILGAGDLWKAARVLEAETELSRLWREASATEIAKLPAPALVFINTHPKEVGTPELAASLEEFRRRVGDRRVIVEIHEAAVTDAETVRELGILLDRLGFGLAYDDFGSGQARLRELTERRPEFLKFDVDLIRGLATAAPERRELTAHLVRMARDLGIPTVAEGIETEADATACRHAGFDYAQGFLFGRPAPAAELTAG